MKTNKSRAKTPVKLIAIIAGAVILLAGIYTAVAATQTWWPFTSQNDNSEQVSPSNEGAPAKDDDKTNTDKEKEIIKEGEDTKQETVKEDEEASTPPATFSVRLISNTDNKTLSAIISKTTNSGTCALTLTRGSAKVTKNAGIQAVSSYSTCKGFDLTTVSAGTWQASVKVTIDGKSTTASKEVIVK